MKIVVGIVAVFAGTVLSGGAVVDIVSASKSVSLPSVSCPADEEPVSCSLDSSREERTVNISTMPAKFAVHSNVLMVWRDKETGKWRSREMDHIKVESAMTEGRDRP